MTYLLFSVSLNYNSRNKNLIKIILFTQNILKFKLKGCNTLNKLANFSSKIVEKYLPSAFIFLVGLTIFVFIVGLYKGFSISEVSLFWGNGLTDLFEFTMQSTLIMVTGFTLAHTPFVNRLLKALANLAKNEVQVIIITVLIMMASAMISWGFGLIAGAIVAREMGIVHRDRIHYPLVVSAAYAGFIVWHAGYGAAIPNLVATEGHFLQDQIGLIPVTETIFSTQNILTIITMAIVIPIMYIWMRPKNEEDRIGFPDSALEQIQKDEEEGKDSIDNVEASSGEKLESYRIISVLVGGLLLLYLLIYFINGGAVDLNKVIISLLALGLLLTPNIKEYGKTFGEGSRTAYSIIFQFPFYAAIMAVMIQTGFASDVAQFFVQFSSAETLPFYSFISAGLINIFVPAGGAQWAVQGPIMVEAANSLNANMSSVVMAVSWGDAWTNYIQPFWALPMLAIAGLGIRHIMGYTIILLFVAGFILSGMFLLLY